MTETVSLTVNTRPVTLSVEPRTHLADALREHLNLTGTHLGCEQGVCGACTVLIDGKPQRSCIAYAVDCDGSEITTIEGFDSDPTMTALREAFSAHHALQCGFCTPGMLVTGRDIVLRLGDISEQRIRTELSGNLCRCTGYVGIVEAIRSVAAGRTPMDRIPLPFREAAEAGAEATLIARPIQQVSTIQASSAAEPAPSPTTTGTQFEEHILLAAPPDQVWAALSDLHRLAACLPGAHVDAIDGNNIVGRVQVSVGPIRASFAGAGTIALNPASRSGILTGQGRDTASGSATTGQIAFSLAPAPSGGTDLSVTITWRLTGRLAQFSRSGLFRDIIHRTAADFAGNLDALASGHQPALPKRLSVLALLWQALKRRLLSVE